MAMQGTALGSFRGAAMRADMSPIRGLRARAAAASSPLAGPSLALPTAIGGGALHRRRRPARAGLNLTTQGRAGAVGGTKGAGAAGIPASVRWPLPRPRPLRSSVRPAAAGGGDAVTDGGSLREKAKSLWLSTRLGRVLAAQVRQLDGLWGQLVPMSILFFLMAFNNTLLDTIKDTLVVTAAGGGVEQIPFLTVFAVFPFSIVFLVMFTVLSTRFSRLALFEICVASLLSFFAVFAWVLFPLRDALTPHQFADGLAAALPIGLTGMVGMIRNWMYTLFYCFAELWGDVVLSLLFWGLANETTGLEDAPLLYPLFGVGANVAQTIAGRLLKVLNDGSGGAADWGHKLNLMMTFVLCVGVLIIGMHRIIVRKSDSEDWARLRSCSVIDHEVEPILLESKIIPTGPLASRTADAGGVTVEKEKVGGADAAGSVAGGGGGAAGAAGEAEGGGEGGAAEAPAAKKSKLSLSEAIEFITKSPQIRFLAIMGLAQGVSTNILEIAWKAQLRILHPTPSAYAGFMGDVATWTGIITLAMMFVSPVLFVRLGWSGAAAATPLILQAGGVLFFGTSILATCLAGKLPPVMLSITVLMGAALYVFSRAAKFSLFKPAEEMVYIGLDEESRTKGKAAVDVVASQAGKSGGSVLQQLLLVVFHGNLAASIPVMAGIFFLVLTSWKNAVHKLAVLVFGEEGDEEWSGAGGAGEGAAAAAAPAVAPA